MVRGHDRVRVGHKYGYHRRPACRAVPCYNVSNETLVLSGQVLGLCK